MIGMSSSLLRVHWNLPLASLLYSSTNPSPSHTSALILSHLLPQKMNSTGSKGFISNLLCTRVTSPSMDFRISVYPHAMYIFSAILISPNMLPAVQAALLQCCAGISLLELLWLHEANERSLQVSAPAQMFWPQAS